MSFMLMPNGFNIIMGVAELNRLLDINLGVHDIEDVYDLCKSGGGNNSYYLWVKANRRCFVNTLEDSNKYAGDDRLFVTGNWEFDESEPSFCRTDTFVYGANARQRRQEAKQVGWARNEVWFWALYSYQGHKGRSTWALLGYEPKYSSFLKRRGRQAFEEEGRTEQVKVAIPAGQRIDFGDWASTSCSTSKPAETSTVTAEAETSSRPSRRVTNPFSSKEEEEEMVLRRRLHVPIADLEA
ncbi:hypothetical protein AAC387_Pa05g0663 [Persea americana]